MMVVLQRKVAGVLAKAARSLLMNSDASLLCIGVFA
jgi:hypothetical protein